MCGIVGVLGPATPKYKNWFSDALVADAVRGKDSTGVFSVDRTNTIVTDKSIAGGASYVKYSNVLGSILSKDSNVVLIGHNRAATRGMITPENAHPFHVGDTVMVHNGTMTRVEGMENYDVDSHALTALLDKKGKAALEESFGAYSIVAYNSVSRLITLARNADRPMCWAATKEGNVLLASELGMLKWLADRNQIEITKTGSTETNKWLQLDPLKLSSVVTEEDISKKTYVNYTWWNKQPRDDVVTPTHWRGETPASDLADWGVNRYENVRFVKHVITSETQQFGTLIGHLTLDPFLEVHVRFTLFEHVKDVIGKTLNVRISEVLENKALDPTLIVYTVNLRKAIDEQYHPQPAQLPASAKEVVPEKESPKVPKFIVNGSLYKDADKKSISKLAWLKIVAKGCTYCGKTMRKSDAITMAYLKEDKSPVCGECAAMFQGDVAYAHQTV